MSRKRIEIASEYRFGHTEISPLSILLGGSIFLLPGNLLKYAGVQLIFGFLITTLLALAVINSTNSLLAQSDMGLRESLTAIGGKTFGNYCESLRLLALCSSIILETIGLGTIIHYFFENITLWQAVLVAGLVMSSLMLLKDMALYHTRSFLTFLGIVAILAFSLTLLGRFFVYLNMGNGVYTANDFSFNCLIEGKWLCLIPIIITLFGGIEDGKDYFTVDIGKKTERENIRYTTMYRITLLYFVTILALSLVFSANEINSDGFFFLKPLSSVLGKEILTIVLGIVIISVGLSNIASRVRLLRKHTLVKTKVLGRWPDLIPLLAVIPIFLIKENAFQWLFAITGLLYAQVWCVLLFFGATSSKKEKKWVSFTLRLVALIVLLSCILQYCFLKDLLAGVILLGMTFTAILIFFLKK